MAQAKVPWSEVQDLMKVMHEYHTLMVQYQDMVSRNHMPADVAEGLCANPIKMINAACSKALTASNIQTSDQVETQKRIERVLQSIVKVQSEIVNKGENARIESLLGQAMSSIKDSINGVITQETENVLQEFKNNF